MEIEEMNQTQPSLWLVNYILNCYEGDKQQHFLQHKRKQGSSKEAYRDRLKSTERKLGYAAVFKDHLKRGTSRRSLHSHS